MRTQVILLCLVGLAYAQHHGGDALGPECIQCGGRGHEHEYPQCLNVKHNCNSNQVCQVNYGSHVGKFESHCKDKAECTHQVSEAHRQCSGGGASVKDSCQVCCSTAGCVTTTIGVATQGGVSALGTHCPDECSVSNIAACLQTGHVCRSDQFCKVTQDDKTMMIQGQCEPLEEMKLCQDQVAEHHCDPHHHHCNRGCCTDEACVAGIFIKATVATTQATTAGAAATASPQMTTTTAAPSSSGSLWELLKGDCVDQLEGAQCNNLDSTQHLCGDRLALRVCPETCGLCAAFHMQECHDTVANNGCATLMAAEDVCSTDLSMHICPVTCNKCDALLEEKITQALMAGTTTTMATLTTTSKVTIPCGDLEGQSCPVVNAACQLNSECPQCAACGSTTVLP